MFTFNPNAGSRSGLQRGVDVFRDYGDRDDPFGPLEAISSMAGVWAACKGVRPPTAS